MDYLIPTVTLLALIVISVIALSYSNFAETFDFGYADRQCAWQLIGVGREVNHSDRYWELQKMRGFNKYRVMPPNMTGSYQVRETKPVKDGDVISLTLRPDIKLIVELGPVSPYYPRP